MDNMKALSEILLKAVQFESYGYESEDLTRVLVHYEYMLLALKYPQHHDADAIQELIRDGEILLSKSTNPMRGRTYRSLSKYFETSKGSEPE